MSANCKRINIDKAKQAARRMYEKTGRDARLFCFIDRDLPIYQHDYMTDWDYYHGAGQGIREEDVYALVFYGTGGTTEPPTLEMEYFD